jgi:hypothetical protein
MALNREIPIRGIALKERKKPESGVEYRLWGSTHGIRLYLKYRTSGMKMYKVTATTTKVSPLAVTAMSPMKKKKMEPCKNVCKVWTVR